MVEPESNVEISSIVVQTFRSLLRKKIHCPDFYFFSLASGNNTTARKPKKVNRRFTLVLDIGKIIKRAQRGAAGRAATDAHVDHEIVTDLNANPPTSFLPIITYRDG